MRGQVRRGVPEEVQQPIRHRLRLYRQSCGINRHNVNVLTGPTIKKYEEEDISSMRLGDLYTLAQRYGMSLQELVEYLFNADDREVAVSDDVTATTQRIITFMSAMDDAERRMMVDLVSRFYQYVLDRKNGINRSLSIRDRLRQQLLDDNHDTQNAAAASVG